jgi:hypothetical protein
MSSVSTQVKRHSLVLMMEATKHGPGNAPAGLWWPSARRHQCTTAVGRGIEPACLGEYTKWGAALPLNRMPNVKV